MKYLKIVRNEYLGYGICRLKSFSFFLGHNELNCESLTVFSPQKTSVFWNPDKTMDVKDNIIIINFHKINITQKSGPLL